LLDDVLLYISCCGVSIVRWSDGFIGRIYLFVRFGAMHANVCRHGDYHWVLGSVVWGFRCSVWGSAAFVYSNAARGLHMRP
jgi:hypothetical protein